MCKLVILGNARQFVSGNTQEIEREEKMESGQQYLWKRKQNSLIFCSHFIRLQINISDTFNSLTFTRVYNEHSSSGQSSFIAAFVVVFSFQFYALFFKLVFHFCTHTHARARALVCCRIRAGVKNKQLSSYCRRKSELQLHCFSPCNFQVHKRAQVFAVVLIHDCFVKWMCHISYFATSLLSLAVAAAAAVVVIFVFLFALLSSWFFGLSTRLVAKEKNRATRTPHKYQETQWNAHKYLL